MGSHCLPPIGNNSRGSLVERKMKFFKIYLKIYTADLLISCPCHQRCMQLACRWLQWQLPVNLYAGEENGLVAWHAHLMGPTSRDLLAQTSSPHLLSHTFQPSNLHLQCSWSGPKLSGRGMGLDSPSPPLQLCCWGCSLQAHIGMGHGLMPAATASHLGKGH